ncbi:MAG: hypothetical protein FIA97_11400 [Methylococcaceae bacterium]|nr:hypothetical protein [Methylococcaceae bacterium]
MRFTHNLARNRIVQRPIGLEKVAARFGLTDRPISLAELWRRLVGVPLAPEITVRPNNVSASPAVQRADVLIRDAGHGTPRAVDRFEFAVFRDGNLVGAATIEAGSGIFRGDTAQTGAGFDRGVGFSLEATARNDAGSALARKAVFFPAITPPPSRPTLAFDRGASRLTGAGFEAGEVVFVRVQVRGNNTIRDSFQLPTGLPQTRADSQGLIATPLDLKAAVPVLVVDDSTDPPTVLAGCAEGDSVSIQAHDDRRDPQSPSNDFLWSFAVHFIC